MMNDLIRKNNKGLASSKTVGLVGLGPWEEVNAAFRYASDPYPSVIPIDLTIRRCDELDDKIKVIAEVVGVPEENVTYQKGRFEISIFEEISS